jgi:hypothetical protein
MRSFPYALLVSSLVVGCSQAPHGSSAAPASDIQFASSTTDKTIVTADANVGIHLTANRQIIYRAAITLQVQSLTETDRQLKALVSKAQGFIAQLHDERSQGAQRGERWTVRIPVGEFEGFLEAVGKLGIADYRDVQSQDVTEEYVDLNSRLKNKQTLEARLLELVAKRGDEIKDILALEAELSRVREEIERIEGRLLLLKDRVALTTIEITAYERLDYTAPNATFTGKLAATFYVSVDRLRQFGETLALGIVALLPWAVVGAGVLIPTITGIRRRIKRTRPVAINAIVS